MTKLAAIATDALGLALAGETTAAVRVIRRAAAARPEAGALLVLYLVDRAIERRQRWRFKVRLSMEDWTEGMAWAGELAAAREARDDERVLALLDRGTCADALLWAVQTIREVRWAERQHAADTLSGPKIGVPEEPEPDLLLLPAEKPAGGWIQRFDPEVDWKADR